MGWPRLFRSRSARVAGISIATVALVVAAAYSLLPLAVEGFTTAIDVTITAGVSLATLVGGGADLTTILITIAREGFRALASPRALGVIAALVLLSAGALYGLQRVLALEEESNAN